MSVTLVGAAVTIGWGSKPGTVSLVQWKPGGFQCYIPELGHLNIGILSPLGLMYTTVLY